MEITKMARLPFPAKSKIVEAVVPTAGAIGALTATVVDGTGFDRVLFVNTTGAAAAGATCTFKIQSSDATGGAYADVTSAALAGLTAAANASKVHCIDMAVDPAKPFMKVVGTIAVDTFINGTIAILYNGRAFPVATSYATQMIQL
jgi:hypothetical protein